MAVKGLPNVGLTCYSNAVFQSFYNLTDFRELILNAELSDKQTFIFYFREIFSLMSENADQDRMEIMCQVFKSYCDKFNLYQQEDANHFITYILNRLESEMNCYSKGNQNKISDIFQGIQEDRIICENCHGDDTISLQKFYTYSITPELKKSKIDELFMRSFAYGGIDGSYCNYCRQPLMKHTYIKKWPKYLIINLSRGQKDPNKSQLMKVESEVLIPKLQLTLSNNCNLYTDDGSDCGNVEYKLVAVINHFGTAYSGHYTCISHTEFSWLEFNDNKIISVEESSVVTKHNNILLFQQQLLQVAQQPMLVHQQESQKPPEEQKESQLKHLESKEETAPDLKMSLPENQNDSPLEQKPPEEQKESQLKHSESKEETAPDLKMSPPENQQESQLELEPRQQEPSPQQEPK